MGAWAIKFGREISTDSYSSRRMAKVRLIDTLAISPALCGKNLTSGTPMKEPTGVGWHITVVVFPPDVVVMLILAESSWMPYVGIVNMGTVTEVCLQLMPSGLVTTSLTVGYSHGWIIEAVNPLAAGPLRARFDVAFPTLPPKLGK
jgi:hypothetical protein